MTNLVKKYPKTTENLGIATQTCESDAKLPRKLVEKSKQTSIASKVMDTAKAAGRTYSAQSQEKYIH